MNIMQSSGRLKHIWQEIICHAPYTFGGALAGIIFMVIFKDMGPETGGKLFSVFHPAHVFLSALVTTSLFAMHTRKKNIFTFLLVGYVGSIGIATLSDSIIPYMGEEFLGVSVPTHATLHVIGHDQETVSHDEHDDGEDHLAEHEEIADGEVCSDPEHHHNHNHGKGLHLGFIEEWYIVNPAALAGIAIAWFMPRSRYPHAAHILMSTWASSSHMLMNTQADMSLLILFGMFIVLAIAVWLPCCVSDIVFPLLFASGDIENSCRCKGAYHHHHDHSTPGPEKHSECDGSCKCRE